MQRERANLAKAWLVDLVERTPLDEVETIEVGWLAREAPRLIADILRALADPELPAELGADPITAARASELRRLRRAADDVARQLPRDLAALHALLIAALWSGLSDGEGADLGAVAQRLAEIFGSVQGVVTRELVREHEGEAIRDRLTGLPGRAELDEWMRVLIASERRYGVPFSVLLVDIDGL